MRRLNVYFLAELNRRGDVVGKKVSELVRVHLLRLKPHALILNLIAGRSRTLPIASFSWSIIARGVFADAESPHHVRNVEIG